MVFETDERELCEDILEFRSDILHSIRSTHMLINLYRTVIKLHEKFIFLS